MWYFYNWHKLNAVNIQNDKSPHHGLLIILKSAAAQHILNK